MFRKFFTMHVKTTMQYKLNTFLLMLSSVLVSASEILAVYILFANFANVKSWGFYEAMLVFGVITTVFAFVECFFRGFDEFDKIIKAGDLDRMLVRPVNVYKQIFYSNFAFYKLGRVILGLTLCIIALCNIGITFTLAKILVIFAMFICGILVILGLMFISAGITVFTIEKMEFIHIITNGTKEMGYYPLNIYNKWFQRFFTYVIPLACFNYLPMNYLLGIGNLPQIVYALSPLIGMLFIIPCFLFFAWSLKHYQSAGT